MIEVYTTLLSLNVGVFGIAISAILVHLELVTSHYSYRAPHILIRRNHLFWMTVVVTIFSSLMSGACLLRLAFPNTDMLPFVNLLSSRWVSTHIFLIITSLLSGIEYVLVFLLISRYLGYFPVRDVVEKMSEQISWEGYKQYLLQANGVSEQYLTNLRNFLDERQDEQKELRKRYEQQQKQVDTEGMENPFALLIDATSAAIFRHDMEGWRIASLAFETNHLALIQSYLQDDDIGLVDLPMNTYMGKEIVKQLRFLGEVAQQEGHPSFALELIDIAGDIAKASVEPKLLEFIGKEIINNFLEYEAERALVPGQEAHLERALAAITQVGVSGIEATTYAASHAAFRSVAKLAEAYMHSGRTMPRSQIATRELLDEKPPGSLRNAFFQFSLKISTLFPEKIALDYWVYLSVTARVIEELIEATSDERDYNGLIWSLLSDIQSIAIHAAGCADAKALERACFYLELLYVISDEKGDPAEICGTIADNFAVLGVAASIRNIPVSPDEIGNLKLPEGNENLVGTILVHMLDCLSITHLHQAMRKAANDAMPPNGVDQVIEQFIKPASKLKNDDFGLSFYWKDPE